MCGNCLSLFVPYFIFFLYLEKSVLLQCDISWVHELKSYPKLFYHFCPFSILHKSILSILSTQFFFFTLPYVYNRHVNKRQKDCLWKQRTHYR